jgi:hypothetical protein
MASMRRAALLLSLQRALLCNVHVELRQASIEADDGKRLVRVRFEYDASPSKVCRECCSIAASEVAADIDQGWQVSEEHAEVPWPQDLSPLANLAYARWEASRAA